MQRMSVFIHQNENGSNFTLNNDEIV